MDRSSDDGQSPPKDHRTRRAHKKSRYGCSKCRERRIKCDEGAPRCSRCEKKNLACDYPKKRQTGLVSPTEYAHQGAQPSRSPNGFLLPEDPTTPCGGSPASPAASEATDMSVEAMQSLSTSIRTEAASSLDPLDFDLFEHFLDHTSKDFTVDRLHQFTLQVGIPWLALQSKFLLKSVLALSCICRCRDIISRPALSLLDSHRHAVTDLLGRAQIYHMDSMHQVQTTRHEASHYDHVLANAAMMGMYGSASHWVRIWILKTSASGHLEICLEFPPTLTQWTRLYRAVTTAYTGLRFDAPATKTMDSMVSSQGSFPATRRQASRDRSPTLTAQTDQQIPPSRKHAFHSVVAATFQFAMDRLRDDANRALIEESSFQVMQLEEWPILDDGRGSEDLRACQAALDILRDIMDHNFAQGIVGAKGRGPASTQSTPGIEMPEDLVEQLSNVSPWLQSYVSRITSTVPSTLPRRYISAFIHKVPIRFLDMVDHAFGWMNGDSLECIPTHETHWLALNIFAHWLVLVLLLDDVWWIGGIGVWELGNVVSLAKDRQKQQLIDTGRRGEWWPESMFAMWKSLEYFSTR